MTPETLIRAAAEDGVQLELSPAGALKVAGKRSAVQRWRPVILEQRTGVLAALEQLAGATAEVNVVNTEVSYCWWQLRYTDRAPMYVAYCPPASHSDVLARETDILAAEPSEPVRRDANTPLSATQETLLRNWLAMISETDADTINELLHRCQVDAEARRYFIRLASGDNRDYK